MLSNERISQFACVAAAAVGVAATVGLFVVTQSGSWISKNTEPPGTTVLLRQLPETRVSLAPTLPPDSEQPTDPSQWKPSVVLPTPPIVEPWSTNIEPAAKPKRPTQSKRARTFPSGKAKNTSRRPKRRGKYTLKSRLAEIQPTAEKRLEAKFRSAKAAWPPKEIAMVAIKDERAVELHARSGKGTWQHIHRYPVLAASGRGGPKLKRGDRQVPEGVYRIVYLNPNSAYHVSLRVNYPSSFDRRMARKDGRKDLGGDIMIHGKKSSAGCLAMGDAAAEELFVLAAMTKRRKVRLIIAPSDFRRGGVPALGSGQPKWLPKLYSRISTAMAEFKPAPKPPQSAGLLSFFSQ